MALEKLKLLILVSWVDKEHPSMVVDQVVPFLKIQGNVRVLVRGSLQQQVFGSKSVRIDGVVGSISIGSRSIETESWEGVNLSWIRSRFLYVSLNFQRINYLVVLVKVHVSTETFPPIKPFMHCLAHCVRTFHEMATLDMVVRIVREVNRVSVVSFPTCSNKMVVANRDNRVGWVEVTQGNFVVVVVSLVVSKINLKIEVLHGKNKREESK